MADFWCKDCLFSAVCLLSPLSWRLDSAVVILCLLCVMFVYVALFLSASVLLCEVFCHLCVMFVSFVLFLSAFVFVPLCEDFSLVMVLICLYDVLACQPPSPTPKSVEHCYYPHSCGTWPGVLLVSLGAASFLISIEYWGWGHTLLGVME